jgi:raffinose/stachyose/melibiose transport system substrate-binding protein
VKRSLSLLIIIALVLVLLSGCGAQTQSTTEQSTMEQNTMNSETTITVKQTDGMKEDNQKEQVSLNFINWGPVDESIFKKFNEKYPNTTVNFQQINTANYNQVIRTRLAGGGDLDVASVRDETYLSFIQSDYLEDLTTNPVLSYYYDWALDQVKSKDGNIFAVPFGTFAEGVWYNKDIFKKLNLEIPKTMDEFVAACEKIKNSGVVPMLSGDKTKWVNYLDALGYIQELVVKDPSIVDKLYDGSVKFTDPMFIDVLTKTKELRNKEYIGKDSLSMDPLQSMQAFAQGKCAMVIQGAWQVNALKDIKLPFEIGAFIMPLGDSNIYTTITPGIKVSVIKSSKYKEAALNFLTFMSDKDGGATTYYNTAGYFSTVKGIEVKEPLLKLWEPIIGNKGYISFRLQLEQPSQDALFNGLQELWTDKSIDQIAKDIQAAHEKALSERTK